MALCISNADLPFNEIVMLQIHHIRPSNLIEYAPKAADDTVVDWVRARVAGVSRFDVVDFGHTTRPINYCRGIKLDEKWLAEFGAEKNGISNHWKLGKGYLKKESGMWVFYMVGDYDYLNIATFLFVHQLQNFYFDVHHSQLKTKSLIQPF